MVSVSLAVPPAEEPEAALRSLIVTPEKGVTGRSLLVVDECVPAMVGRTARSVSVTEVLPSLALCPAVWLPPLLKVTWSVSEKVVGVELLGAPLPGVNTRASRIAVTAGALAAAIV